MKRLVLTAALALATATTTAAFAEGIMIKDPYARAASPSAKSGAAFMQIMNHSDINDRLIGVTSDAAARTELHTHTENAEGVMQMIHVEEGFALPAGETMELARGGKHVMFMGLSGPFEQGSTVDLTLVFENAGEIVVEVPVDNERKAMKGHEHDH